MNRRLKRAVGVLIGALYFVVAGLAYRISMEGWNAGHADVGFWWGVIAALLAIAGASAVIGAWLHTRARTP